MNTPQIFYFLIYFASLQAVLAIGRIGQLDQLDIGLIGLVPISPNNQLDNWTLTNSN